MSGKKANNHPGLRPIKGQQPSLSGTARAQDQLSSLSLSASKSLPQYQVLFIQPTLNLLLYTVPRDSQGRLRSNKIVNGTPPFELIGNFISTYSRMSGDPKESHRVIGGDIIQRPLALRDRHDEDNSRCSQFHHSP
jgi:hypothetical protein